MMTLKTYREWIKNYPEYELRDSLESDLKYQLHEGKHTQAYGCLCCGPSRGGHTCASCLRSIIAELDAEERKETE